MMARSFILGFAAMLLAGTALAQTAVDSGLPIAPPAPSTPEINLPPSMPPSVEASAPAPAEQPVPAPQEMPAEAAALPSVPDESGAYAVASGRNFSFGSAPSSLLFTPAQIGNMKKALSAFESIRPEDKVSDVTVTEALPVEPVQVEEPATYPVYYLSSIVYRSSGDWTVWINNTRITPKMNNGEVKVTAVKPDRAWFSWEPTYMQAIVGRINQKSFAPTNKVKHRLTSENTAAFNRETGTIQFSLKPNQSFAPGYFNTFEGKIDPPVILAADPKSDPMSQMQADTINGLLGAGRPPAIARDRETMDELISNQRRMLPRQGQASPLNPAP